MLQYTVQYSDVDSVLYCWATDRDTACNSGEQISYYSCPCKLSSSPVVLLLAPAVSPLPGRTGPQSTSKTRCARIHSPSKFSRGPHSTSHPHPLEHASNL